MHRQGAAGETKGAAYMGQAFISYHRAQRKLARQIAHRIAADGHSVWWDRGERPGDAWSEAVSTALANAACVVVIWSKQAAASPWVLGEATAGYGRNALVSVCADRTPPPSPFDKGPIVDMQDWTGEGDDVAWIRLRDPVRAKLEAAEKKAVDDAPLPPAPRPPPSPARVSFAGPALADPPYVEERRRGGGAGGFMTLLLLGGAAAAAWYWRAPLNEELLALRETWRQPPREAGVAEIPPPPPAPIQEAAAPSAVAPVPELPAPVEPGALDQPLAEARAPVQDLIESAPRMTYDWRDSYIPAPTMRTLPPAEERKAPPPAVARAAFTEIPPPPPVAGAPEPRRLAIPQGRFMDIDPAGARRETDLWFAPDRTGYGLFLGTTNGARMRLVSAARADPQKCKDIVLRRTPIPVRELERDAGLCVRSSTGALSAWRVERVERADGQSLLRLVAVGS